MFSRRVYAAYYAPVRWLSGKETGGIYWEMMIQYDFEHIFGKKIGKFEIFFAGFNIDFGKCRVDAHTHAICCCMTNVGANVHLLTRLKVRASKQFIAAKAIRYDVDNQASMSRRESR